MEGPNFGSGPCGPCHYMDALLRQEARRRREGSDAPIEERVDAAWRSVANRKDGWVREGQLVARGRGGRKRQLVDATTEPKPIDTQWPHEMTQWRHSRLITISRWVRHVRQDPACPYLRPKPQGPDRSLRSARSSEERWRRIVPLWGLARTGFQSRAVGRSTWLIEKAVLHRIEHPDDVELSTWDRPDARMSRDGWRHIRDYHPWTYVRIEHPWVSSAFPAEMIERARELRARGGAAPSDGLVEDARVDRLNRATLARDAIEDSSGFGLIDLGKLGLTQSERDRAIAELADRDAIGRYHYF